MTASQTAAQPDPTREIIAQCKRETQIRYKSKGNTFFRPRMRGINTLQVGKSKIIDSPVTITIEWIFEQFRRRCQGNGGSSTCSATAISRAAIYATRARHSAKAAERLCL
jgi:hypothetical protein